MSPGLAGGIFVFGGVASKLPLTQRIDLAVLEALICFGDNREFYRA